MSRRVTLSAAEARRAAIAVQGLAGPRPARPGATHLRGMLRRLALVQIDSVNVLVRSHYLPPFARLGAYDRSLLDGAAFQRRELFEYWAHEASFVPVELHPLLRWRMERIAADERWNRIERELPDFVESVYEEVAERGPLRASDLSQPGERRGPWWGWAAGKTALEWLFSIGRLSVAGRRNFERLYDLTERVLPRAVLDVPTPPADGAHRRLLTIASRALGVATAADLADYFRIGTQKARPRIAELVEEGTLLPVAVAGWRDQAYIATGARIPRTLDARALLSPFDSMVWFRPRAERLFGFRYRIEIYTPRPKRVYGYYVLPFLLGDRLVARVDLKADRGTSALRVHAAFCEPGMAAEEVARLLAGELGLLAAWLGLSRVEVGDRGDLAAALRRREA